MADAALRIDRLLFFLRFAKSRTLAQGWAEAGHIRVNGRRIEKGSVAVEIGDVITLPKGEVVLVIELLALPVRRGPVAEAQLCYRLRE
jgi:ribosome-associated heat shock protein Hsp15